MTKSIDFDDSSNGPLSYEDLVVAIASTAENLTRDHTDAVHALIDATALLAGKYGIDITQLSQRLYATHTQVSIAKEASERPNSRA